MLGHKQVRLATFGNRDCPLLPVTGSVRSGKTWAATRGVWQKAARMGRGLNIGLIARSRANMTGTLERYAVGWAAELRLPYKSSADFFTLPSRLGGHNRFWRVVLGEGSKSAADRITGVGFDMIYIDELTLCPREMFDIANQRLLDAKDPRLIGTTNPSGPQHWVKTDLIDRIDEGELHGETMTFRLIDNPVMVSSPAKLAIVREMARRMTQVEYDRKILARWVAAEGLVHPHVHYEYPPPGRAHDYAVALDYGQGTVTHALIIGVYDTHAHVEAEWRWDAAEKGQISHAEAAQTIHEWATREAGRNIALWVVPDDAQAFAECLTGVIGQADRDPGDVIEAVKDLDYGIEIVNYMSELDTPELRVSAECEDLGRELGRYEYDKTQAMAGKQTPNKKSAGGAHGCDAFRYGAVAVWQQWTGMTA